MCGLFAYISKKDNHNFNWDKFNHLGLDNDERGGDSVGRVVGDTIVKFVNNRKAKTTYQEYVINNKNSEPNHIAIGHTRKASIGVINETNAQPVVIDLPNGQKFIMVHNGTIFNWEDLAKKHGIISTGKTDSMVLAEIISSQGYDVLKEYDGAAALIIKDDRDPDTLKVFRGESKNFSQKLDEERPLYYYQESENSMYISSREEGLYFIGGEPENVIEFETNKLYTIYQGQIINEEEYDRTNCSSVKIWPKVERAVDNNPYRYAYGSYGRKDYATEEDAYDSFDAYYEGRYLGANVRESNVKPNMRKDIIPSSTQSNKIIQARLRYYFWKRGHEPYYANGIIKLNEEGEVWERKSLSAGKDYYFYSGIMLKDLESYYKVKEEFGKARQFIDSCNNLSSICRYSVYPVCTIDAATPAYGNIKHFTSSINSVTGAVLYTASWYSGTIKPIFSYKEYIISAGDLTKTIFSALPNLPTHEIKLVKSTDPFPANCMQPVPTHEFITEGLCTKVTRALVEKAVNNSNRVNGFVSAEKLEEFTEKSKNALNVRDFTSDDDESQFTTVYDMETEEPWDMDDTDCEDDDDKATDFVSKAISNGVDGILKSIDEAIQELECLGVNSAALANTLSNFYKLQDPFLSIKDFKKKPLIISYEQF